MYIYIYCLLNSCTISDTYVISFQLKNFQLNPFIVQATDENVLNSIKKTDFILNSTEMRIRMPPT